MRFLKYELELWKKTKSHRSTTLQRRLIAFFSMVVISVILLFTLLLILFGITGSGRQTVYRYLESELLHIASSTDKDLGNLSVTGIHLAEQLAREGSRISDEQGVPLSELLSSRNPALLSAQMSALLSVAEHNPCGGVFLVLDAPKESEKLPGIFVKKTQPLSSASMAAKAYCLRGSADTARAHGVELLAQWQMDYNRSELPFFETVMETARENPDLPLSRLYYWSGRIRLIGNSEAGVLLSLPLIDEDGTVYGICGIEVSDRMFKQLYSPSESVYQGVFAIAAPTDGDLLEAQNGLIAGNSFLTGSQMTAPFTPASSDQGFLFFDGERDSYGGILSELNLYPTGSAYAENWIMAVLMPRDRLERAIRGNSAALFAIVAALLAVSLISCVFISQRYLRPIHQGLSSIREKAYETESETVDFGVVEIDNLFAELSQSIREHREEMTQLRLAHQDTQIQMEKVQTKLDRLTDKKKEEIDPEEYSCFLENLKYLTSAEQRVFELYLEGKTPKEIMEILQIKENTLKYHNRNIYGKLGVTSRKQLLQFAALMK